MKTINYKITFHTYWHCGSGLAAGANVDALVVKDKDGMPFVPGKTIKGLVREAFTLLNTDAEAVKQIFGIEGDARCDSFFTNAVMDEKEHEFIVSQNAASYLYRTLASTAIEDNGIARDNSLRSIQVTVPCTLTGEIHNIPDDKSELITNALRYIKRLGQWRNRGLGRCTIETPNKEGGKQ